MGNVATVVVIAVVILAAYCKANADMHRENHNPSVQQTTDGENDGIDDSTNDSLNLRQQANQIEAAQENQQKVDSIVRYDNGLKKAKKLIAWYYDYWKTENKNGKDDLKIPVYTFLSYYYKDFTSQEKAKYNEIENN